MSRLEPHERDCLARFAELGAEGLPPCERDVIRHLLSMRLIEEVVEVGVVLPRIRRRCRITVAGLAALDQGD
jgi:hypothetical protein